MRSGADVVLTSTTYGNLTVEQQEYLTSKGVNIVPLGALGIPWTTHQDLLDAVAVVGELLKDADSIQFDSVEMASEYNRQVTNTLARVKSANGGLSTWSSTNWKSLNTSYEYQPGQSPIVQTSMNKYVCAFVDGWATSRSSTWNKDSDFVIHPNRPEYDISEGVGLSQRLYGVSYNNSRFSLMMYYEQHAGAIDLAWLEGSYNQRDWIRGAHSGEVLDYPFDFGAGICGDNLLWSYADNSTAYLGSIQFPAIVVKDARYKDLIASSAGKTFTMYNAFGNLDAYQVWVMPSGLYGSWADGTVESFLFAPWAYCMYQANQDLSTCSPFVNSFYSTFYRCGADGVVDNYKTTFDIQCAK